MRLYLDDDSARLLLVKLLIQAGHDVQTPADANTTGRSDPEHLIHSISDNRVLLSGNHHDFVVLHDLVMKATGHHPGILVVRKDNDLARDLSPPWDRACDSESACFRSADCRSIDRAQSLAVNSVGPLPLKLLEAKKSGAKR